MQEAADATGMTLKDLSMQYGDIGIDAAFADATVEAQNFGLELGNAADTWNNTSTMARHINPFVLEDMQISLPEINPDVIEIWLNDLYFNLNDSDLLYDAGGHVIGESPGWPRRRVDCKARYG